MDLVTYGRFALALAVVIGLIAGLSWLMRKYGQGRLTSGGMRGRIAIVEVTGLDTRRRLVLLRRDNVEHLVILGPTGETVVERGIVGAPPVPSPASPSTLTAGPAS